MYRVENITLLSKYFTLKVLNSTKSNNKGITIVNRCIPREWKDWKTMTSHECSDFEVGAIIIQVTEHAETSEAWFLIFFSRYPFL